MFEKAPTVTSILAHYQIRFFECPKSSKCYIFEVSNGGCDEGEHDLCVEKIWWKIWNNFSYHINELIIKNKICSYNSLCLHTEIWKMNNYISTKYGSEYDLGFYCFTCCSNFFFNSDEDIKEFIWIKISWYFWDFCSPPIYDRTEPPFSENKFMLEDKRGEKHII